MKIRLFWTLTWLFGAACAQPSAPKADLAPPAPVSDEEAVENLMNRLFASVDARQWGDVRTLMHDSVQVDYSALGGDVGVRTPEELTGAWASFLPGFERTVHQPHNHAVWVAGDRATATLDAIATHYLSTDTGEPFWTVFVGYDTEFVRRDGKWKLARIDLSLYDMVGNGALPQEAAAQMEAGGVPLASESRATKTVDAFLAALEARDLDLLLSTLDDSVVQDMPLAPEGFPKQLEGKAAMEAQYRGVMGYEQSYARAFYPTADPNTVLVKFEGTITTSEGKPYNNRYVGIYTVNEAGQIARFVEHFNPRILLSGWPGLKPLHYSMHAAGASTRSGVELKSVSFDSNGDTLRGHLFLPPGFDPARRYPTAVVTGSWTSVKEQMPDEYASLLAKSGLIALTFDFRGFGESEGEPRQFEDSERKIEDIVAAVDYLLSHQNVDGTQIAALGVCASSGYVAHAAAREERIQRVVLVAPWLHNPEIARMIYDLRPGGTDGLLAAAVAAKKEYDERGATEMVLAASELDPLSAMYVPNNAFDYYLNPAKAAGPLYDNRFAVMSWKPWLTFDGISVAEVVKQPVFIVHSESGAVPQGAKAFYDGLKGEREIVWLNQFNQQDLYMNPEAVNAAMDAVSAYLNSAETAKR